jgi:hypothetical protein
MKIVTTDGEDLQGQAQGALIPPEQMIDHVETDEVKWVLVVEKEVRLLLFSPREQQSNLSSFLAGRFSDALRSSSLLDHESIGNGVLLTGKGYPDLATRELVKRLSDDLPSSVSTLPFFSSSVPDLSSTPYTAPPSSPSSIPILTASKSSPPTATAPPPSLSTQQTSPSTGSSGSASKEPSGTRLGSRGRACCR